MSDFYGPKLANCETVPLRGWHVEQVSGIADIPDETSIGWAFVQGHFCVGFIGILTLNNGMELASVHLRHGVRFQPSWHRWAKYLMSEFFAAGFDRLLCTCDETKTNAAAWLERIGFREILDPKEQEKLVACGMRLFECRI